MLADFFAGKVALSGNFCIGKGQKARAKPDTENLSVYSEQRSEALLARSTVCMMIAIALFVVLFWKASAASAAEWLAEYPRASQEMNKQEELPEYRMAMGRIQNKNSGSEPEYWLNLSAGHLSRHLYRIRSTKDTADISRYYQQQLQVAGARILFECQGRECGSSTDWANRVFRVSTLYGVDRKQHYFLAAREDNGQTHVAAIYVTERGTGRIYAYEEHFLLKSGQLSLPGEEQTLFQQLEQQGWITLPVSPDGRFEEGAFGDLQVLVGSLPEQKRYWLVAHRFGQDSDAALLNKSTQAAQNLLSQLRAMGLAEDRIEIKGMGRLAPTTESLRYGGRIELIEKRN
ncbi:DUF4892 domain-containing protein [Oceanospirillum sediminis]|uniref:DUF4892 domain-containing protein n=1 Tax=Oceanospirillum sediminis TaxID=2760088 RepID=A0A839IR97_9GAMM|nr:DUF4892 domain-containing protein [Oceanospirillum sediminis]MBB1487019.1 DUF4892 domain-containing protein [Oceanospirillum sediminis]